MTGAEWVTAELAVYQFRTAMSVYGAALLADDLATAAAALVEVFQRAEQLGDELTVWSGMRGALPSWMPAWDPN